MKQLILLILSLALFLDTAYSQSRNTKVFTIFTSSGCGCTGSGGPPETFTTNEDVLTDLEKTCNGIEFMLFEGNVTEAWNDVQANKSEYDGVLIVGRLDRDYRLAFTGLPTIIVYNLFEFQSGHHYHIYATGKVKDDKVNILQGGENYNEVKILNAQLDRRNLCDPEVTGSMFDDLVYKIKLIRAIKEMKETRILMVKGSKDEIIASVNYKYGDHDQSYPEDHNERYLENFRELLGVDIVTVEADEFYEAYKNTKLSEAEKLADLWIMNARKVEASRREIIKSVRGYLALDALREKYD
ncbi:MAG: hypothetical protein PHN68_10260, partial [Prolixibacteraceae bacterium]|nr:hypothetical protein [Prolixibacteraceae bacterium]